MLVNRIYELKNIEDRRGETDRKYKVKRNKDLRRIIEVVRTKHR